MQSGPPEAPNLVSRELAPRRLEHLRDIARQGRIVRVRDLCARLRVSPATVRRDLEELERRGTLRRVHGGAVCEESLLEEPHFDDKASFAAAEKRRIAAAALRYIQPGDAVFLDGGSTVLELARLLREWTQPQGGSKQLTVVTNSLPVGMELAGRGPRLILLGGELRRRSQTLVGALTRPVLQELNIDRAFMGTLGLTLAEGPSTTDPNEAYTKELVMSRAREVFLLADHTKLGQTSFVRFGGWSRVRALITDRGVDRAFARTLARRGVQVVRA